MIFIALILGLGLNNIVKHQHSGGTVSSPERSLLGHHSSYARNDLERGPEEEIDLITSQRSSNLARQPPTNIFDDL